MPATEDQRAGPVEGIDHGQQRAGEQAGEQRQPEQQGAEQGQPEQPRAAPDADRQWLMRRTRLWPERHQADERGGDDDPHLTPGGRHEQHAAGRRHHDGNAWHIGAQRARHAPHGLGDHRHGDHLQAVQHASRHGIAIAGDTQRKEDQGNRGGQGEAQPGSQRARIARTRQPQRHAHLAAGRPRKELAQGDQIRIAALAQPVPTHHELVAEVAQVSDRAAE